jgi:hypothetical protein
MRRALLARQSQVQKRQKHIRPIGTATGSTTRSPNPQGIAPNIAKPMNESSAKKTVPKFCAVREKLWPIALKIPARPDKIA